MQNMQIMKRAVPCTFDMESRIAAMLGMYDC